ncbi:hypothetical protein [Candidatus Poriferisocius sp.]|uniref:hypothetical protein n=1 Tax=Candidatus Poriferisocius sp. TaxID=3101276 RepID=UPI003B5AF507
MTDIPHPTVLLGLASVTVSMGAVPLCWAGHAHLGPQLHTLFVALTVLAMVLLTVAIWALFSARWTDRTHPSLLMGTAAVAVSATALPLRCAGHTVSGPPHVGFFLAVTVVALVFASSCMFTALGRLAPGRIPVPPTAGAEATPERSLQAFPGSLDPAALDDIAHTYHQVQEAIRTAHQTGSCTKVLIRLQADRLRSLADRIGTSPTAEAIRAEAGMFDRKARRAARCPHSAAAQDIATRCSRHVAAAATVANHRRSR